VHGKTVQLLASRLVVVLQHIALVVRYIQYVAVVQLFQWKRFVNTEFDLLWRQCVGTEFDLLWRQCVGTEFDQQ
jgi:hypothetical protein